MKKAFLICAALLALGANMFAQESLLQDYDSTLSVQCSYKDIRFYVDKSFHIPPMANLARGDEDVHHHKCTGDDENEQAQAIFLARLDMLREPSIRHKTLSVEIKKMVYNFELITGTRNTYDDGDLLGRLYISSAALQGWEKWFKENKDRLCYCPVYHVLYLAYQSK